MKQKIIVTGFFLFSFLFPLQAKAVSLFSQIYVFGDSLSDPGNVFRATDGLIPPSPPYFEGRFSNGLVWVEYLAEDLELTPDVETNFAFGGATTGSTNTILPVLPGLQQQISGFTSANPTADPDALYIVFAGANDYLSAGITDPTIPVTNLANAVTSIVEVGAQNILVPNLPPLGELPRTNNTEFSDALNTLTDLHNSALSVALNNLNQSLDPSVNIVPLDLNAFFSEAIANPASFGLTNVSNACLTNVDFLFDTNYDICENPNEFLFWDDIHPTTIIHQQSATLALNTLSAQEAARTPESSSALGILALGGLGVGSRLLQKRSKTSPVEDKVSSSLLS